MQSSSQTQTSTTNYVASNSIPNQNSVSTGNIVSSFDFMIGAIVGGIILVIGSIAAIYLTAHRRRAIISDPAIGYVQGNSF